MGKMIKLEPNIENHCFGCGASNDAGMKLLFELDLDERQTRGRFTLGKNYAGGGGFAHGGIIAVVLERAVTAEMSVEYKRPVPVDREISVVGWQEEEKGRNRFRVAEIRDSRGELLARGKGRFVVVNEEHFAKALGNQAVSVNEKK
jgi:acyl-coenzyme A thioesterase PaaI-like protein